MFSHLSFDNVCIQVVFMDMCNQYRPQEYWQKRLTYNYNLRGVGHIGFNQFYNSWLYRKKRNALRKFFHGQDLRGKKVLDIGCGTGFFTEWYLLRGAVVIGMDIAPVAIEKLSKKFPQVYFSLADISSSLYSPIESYDIINIWDVIYHIVDDDGYDIALKNIARSSKKETLLLMTDQFGSPVDCHTAFHVKFRCLRTHEKKLSQIGFRSFKVMPLYKYLNKSFTNVRFLNNNLAPLFYIMDALQKKVPDDNISLLAAIKE